MSALPPRVQVCLARTSHRVIFVDLARALAVFFMIYGHTVAALLAPEYQRRHLVRRVAAPARASRRACSCMLGGFAFSLATRRHWASHIRDDARHQAPGCDGSPGSCSSATGCTCRSAGPGPRTSSRPGTGGRFHAVDVLQLIGVTLIGVQCLALVARARAPFMWPAVRAGDRPRVRLAAVLGNRLEPPLSPGLCALSLPVLGPGFPLLPAVPWSAFVLVGAGARANVPRGGAARTSEAFANRVLLVPGTPCCWRRATAQVAAAGGVRQRARSGCRWNSSSAPGHAWPSWAASPRRVGAWCACRGCSAPSRRNTGSLLRPPLRGLRVGVETTGWSGSTARRSGRGRPRPSWAGSWWRCRRWRGGGTG